MTKPLPIILALFLLAPSLYARTRVDLGFDGGVMNPNVQTINADAIFRGNLGVIDDATGLEFRGSVGFFSSISTDAELAGQGLKMELKPLTGTILYHLGDAGSSIQPYIGAGVGAYFYTVSDSEFGQLESGTKFGTHVLGGLKWNLSRQFYIASEYSYALIPKTFFQGADNFNTAMITIGIGFKLEPISYPQHSVADDDDPAPISSSELNALSDEIAKMKEMRDKIESKIDAFYENTEYEATIGVIAAATKDSLPLGTTVIITDPISGILIAKGSLEFAKTDLSTITLQLKNEQGWGIPVQIEKSPISVTIGVHHYPSFSKDNVDQFLVMTTLKNEVDAAKELRKVRYYEEKLKTLDKKIEEAQKTLVSMRKELQARNTAPASTSTTIYVEDHYQSPVIVPVMPHRHRYRYYRPQEYVAPPVVPSTPPSLEERQEYLKRKQDHINALKKRK
jgi:outer membrane protein W